MASSTSQSAQKSTSKSSILKQKIQLDKYGACWGEGDSGLKIYCECGLNCVIRIAPTLKNGRKEFFSCSLYKVA